MKSNRKWAIRLKIAGIPLSVTLVAFCVVLDWTSTQRRLTFNWTSDTTYHEVTLNDHQLSWLTLEDWWIDQKLRLFNLPVEDGCDPFASVGMHELDCQDLGLIRTARGKFTSSAIHINENTPLTPIAKPESLPMSIWFTRPVSIWSLPLLRWITAGVLFCIWIIWRHLRKDAKPEPSASQEPSSGPSGTPSLNNIEPFPHADG